MSAMNPTVWILISLALSACDSHRQRCIDNGGRWTSFNCHSVEDMNCATTDYGQGMVITSCMPSTSVVCDYFCKGASSEVGHDDRP